MIDTKLLKIPGEKLGFSGEYLRVWATYNDGSITSMRISGFGRNGRGNPSDADAVPYTADVPQDRREELKAWLAHNYLLRIEDVDYWR